MTKRGSRAVGLTLLALGLLALALSHWPVRAHAEGDHVALVKIDGVIDAVSSRYLARAINKAADEGAALVVVQLDTPGGRIDSMRDMVEAILGSRTPLAVYVSPRARRRRRPERSLRQPPTSRPWRQRRTSAPRRP